MLKHFVKILLFTAQIIFLLHAVIPHEHHNEMQSGEDSKIHATATTVFDFLSTVFHEDLGTENLNEFRSDSVNSTLELLIQVAFAIGGAFLVAFTIILVERTPQKFYIPFNQSLPYYVTIKANSRRGPPKK